MHPTICSESVLNSLSCKNECFFRRRLFWYFFGLFFHRALNSTAKKSYPSNISASSDPSPEEQNLMLEGRRRCFVMEKIFFESNLGYSQMKVKFYKEIMDFIRNFQFFQWKFEIWNFWDPQNEKNRVFKKRIFEAI